MARGAKVVKFPGPAIEPDLKEFIDECLVPMLVRDALKDAANEIHLAHSNRIGGQCARRENAS